MAAIHTYYALRVPTGLLTLSLGYHCSRSIDPWIYVCPNHPWFRQNDRICHDWAKRLSSPVPLDQKCSKPSPTCAQERIGFNQVPPNTQRLVSLYTFSTGLVSMPIITIGARKDMDTEVSNFQVRPHAQIDRHNPVPLKKLHENSLYHTVSQPALSSGNF